MKQISFMFHCFVKIVKILRSSYYFVINGITSERVVKSRVQFSLKKPAEE